MRGQRKILWLRTSVVRHWTSNLLRICIQTDDEDKMTALDLAKIGGHDDIVHLLSYD